MCPAWADRKICSQFHQSTSGNLPWYVSSSCHDMFPQVAMKCLLKLPWHVSSSCHISAGGEAAQIPIIYHAGSNHDISCSQLMRRPAGRDNIDFIVHSTEFHHDMCPRLVMCELAGKNTVCFIVHHSETNYDVSWLQVMHGQKGKDNIQFVASYSWWRIFFSGDAWACRKGYRLSQWGN